MTYQPNRNKYNAFGDQVFVQIHPEVQLSNTYGLIRDDVETFTNGTGATVDSNDNLYRCQSGTDAGGFGVLRSKAAIRYRPGIGVLGRFTAIFTSGVANSLQFAGMFNLTDTLAFGYDGTSFSVIHDSHGAAEVRLITVTGAASGSESATVTLDSVAFTANLTNTTAAGNAFEIARDGNADATIGAQWHFEQNGDTVNVLAKSVGDKTGTFSFSSATATATVAESRAGAAKTEMRVAQASWNRNAAASLDPTKINVYEIRYGFLGAANMTFHWLDPAVGDFVKVHEMEHANTGVITNIGNPALKVGWVSSSVSSTTNLTVQGASALLAIEGEEVVTETPHSTFFEDTGVTATLSNILTLRCRQVYGDRVNLGEIEPVDISVDNDSTKGIIVEVIKNTALGGVPNYSYIDQTNSIAEVDTSGTTITGGTLIDTFTVPSGGDADIDLLRLKQFILPDETLTVAAKLTGGASTKVTASINWLEEI
jgi:hypothetical protein